jgi:hypothetical protein
VTKPVAREQAENVWTSLTLARKFFSVSWLTSEHHQRPGAHTEAPPDTESEETI